MELVLYAAAALYGAFGLRYLVKSLSSFAHLLRRGRRHPEAVTARLAGAPEWAIGGCLVLAIGAAGLTAFLMASLWPLILMVDRTIKWD
ncbi:MAG: hypothetical protein HYX99_01635 [Chloroflexi bacterium]|nr:hypothetical protein [Chloroflexota bacterium]